MLRIASDGPLRVSVRARREAVRPASLAACLAVALVLVAAPARTDQVFHSPGDDGAPGGVIPEGGVQPVHLYVDGGSSPSAPGRACHDGAGDEVCGFDLELTARSPYKPYDVSKNTLYGKFAQINLAANEKVDLRVTMRRSCASARSCNVCTEPSMTAVERVPYHVHPELPRCTDDADLHDWRARRWVNGPSLTARRR